MVFRGFYILNKNIVPICNKNKIPFMLPDIIGTYLLFPILINEDKTNL